MNYSYFKITNLDKITPRDFLPRTFFFLGSAHPAKGRKISVESTVASQTWVIVIITWPQRLSIITRDNVGTRPERVLRIMRQSFRVRVLGRSPPRLSCRKCAVSSLISAQNQIIRLLSTRICMCMFVCVCTLCFGVYLCMLENAYVFGQGTCGVRAKNNVRCTV